jgi:hypothetical protein
MEAPVVLFAYVLPENTLDKATRLLIVIDFASILGILFSPAQHEFSDFIRRLRLVPKLKYCGWDLQGGSLIHRESNLQTLHRYKS